MKKTAVKVENISKTFRLPIENTGSIKNLLINFKSRQKGYEIQDALKGVSLEIKKGEFFGIVGRNGSGKSTLLKLLAGIYTPTSGSIVINGKLTPFIELGVGFSPELTGRENIFLNGALLGFNRKEIQAIYNDIVEFAELERFMDQKLKNYSSGMQVRLAFSIAIRAQSDILVLDEVLAVGDLDFQQKCFDYFSTLRRDKKTVILVTHDMGSVLKFCDKAMLLSDGIVQAIGKPKEIADLYIEENYQKTQIKHKKENKQNKNMDTAYIQKVTLDNGNKSKYKTGEACKITLYFKNPKKQPIHFGLQIFNNEGVYCFGTNTKISNRPPKKEASGSVSLKTRLDLVPGQYSVTAATMSYDGMKIYDYRPNVAFFRIQKDNQIEGIANLNQEWENT